MDLIFFKQIHLLHNIYNKQVHRLVYLLLHHYWHHPMPMDFMVIKLFFLFSFFLQSTWSSRLYICFHSCMLATISSHRFSWSSISPSLSFFCVCVFFLSLSLSMCVLSSDYSAKPCLKIKARTNILFYQDSFLPLLLSSNLSIVIFMCVCVFFRHSFVCHLSSFVYTTTTHCFWKTILSHIIFYLFVAFFVFVFIYKHSVSATCTRSLLFVSDLDFFVCADRAFFEHECLFLFFFLCVPFFFQDKSESKKIN